MHDLALYRKYRPQKFKDVLGQEQIVGVLEKSIQDGNVSHLDPNGALLKSAPTGFDTLTDIDLSPTG